MLFLGLFLLFIEHSLYNMDIIVFGRKLKVLEESYYVSRDVLEANLGVGYMILVPS